MSRYIDADAIKDKAWKAESEACFYALEDVVSVTDIDEAPSIEPKRGAWKIEETESVWGKGYMLTCSECGNTFRVTENALPYEKYCRNCGAKMKGADDE